MFSDPVERRRADGTVIMPGHWGCIYQSASAVFLGRGTPRTLRLLPDGTVFSDRAASKIRSRDRGHEYAERQLMAFGARAPRAEEDPASWLAEAEADAGVRNIRHPGVFRYAFLLGTRRQRASVAIALPARPYPKRDRDRQLGLFGETA